MIHYDRAKHPRASRVAHTDCTENPVEESRSSVGHQSAAGVAADVVAEAVLRNRSYPKSRLHKDYNTDHDVRTKGVEGGARVH